MKSIRTLINDGPVVTYRAGENFSEMPGDRYSVDENASNTEPREAARRVRGRYRREGIDDAVRKIRRPASSSKS